jgi:hypothetical protein
MSRNKPAALWVRRGMDEEKPTALQILVAWRDNKWVVLRDTAQVGAYAYRSHAMAMARTLSAQAAALGLDCYMLVRERDGSWDEHPCPKPTGD